MNERKRNDLHLHDCYCEWLKGTTSYAKNAIIVGGPFDEHVQDDKVQNTNQK